MISSPFVSIGAISLRASETVWQETGRRLLSPIVQTFCTTLGRAPHRAYAVYYGNQTSCQPQALGAWRQALVDLRQHLVALDGQTLQRSLDSIDGLGSLHAAG